MSSNDKKRLAPHIIIWILGAIATIIGRSTLFYFGGFVLILDFFVLVYMSCLGKFEGKSLLYTIPLIPLLFCIIGYLRLTPKILISAAVTLLCISAYAQSENDIIKSADALNHNKGDYNVAAERYWQAATKYASQNAIVKLSDLYKNRKPWFEKDYGYDWSIPRKYIQQAADSFYPHEQAEFVNTDFIIIASEDAIIGQAVWNLQKVDYAHNQGLRHDGYTKFPGNNLCGIAIDIVKKDIKIKGKLGDFVARSRYFSNIGNVAVVDRDTAIRQFDFTNIPRKEWMVYVRCPVNKNLLIPFADFHRYVYQEKMAAFIKICRKLAAKSIKISFSKTNQNGEKYTVGVSGGVADYGSAKVQTAIARTQDSKENTNANYEFERSIRISPLDHVDKLWLDSEPTWREMYACRQAVSPIKKFIAKFTYNESCKVDLNASISFSNAYWNLGAEAGASFEKFEAVEWEMCVDFYNPWF